MPDPNVVSSISNWWNAQVKQRGFWGAIPRLGGILREFIRDSMPSRRKQRYGDAGFDWEYRVDTTSATVDWRTRLVGLFHSPYQPTDAALFHSMLEALHIDYSSFTFIDIGSGKGRVLLVAADYPFHEIIGVELMPDLHQIAVENIRKYRSNSQKCYQIKAVCADAQDFEFPDKPVVVYLFNPLPEEASAKLAARLHQSVRENPRPVYVIYHNPEFAYLFRDREFRNIRETHQYSVFTSVAENRPAQVGSPKKE